MKAILELYRTYYKQSHETWRIEIKHSDTLPKRGDEIRLGAAIHTIYPSRKGLEKGVPVYTAEIQTGIYDSKKKVIADYGFHKSHKFRKL